MQRKCYYIIIYILKEEQVKWIPNWKSVLCKGTWSWVPFWMFSPPGPWAQEAPGNRSVVWGKRMDYSNYLQIRSLLMETASFPRSASGFPRYPLFLIDFGQSKSVYKQESLSCWLLCTLSFKGRKVKTSKMGRIPLDQKSVRAVKLPSCICVLLKMCQVDMERNCSNQDCRIQLGFCCLGKTPSE